MCNVKVGYHGRARSPMLLFSYSIIHGHVTIHIPGDEIDDCGLKIHPMDCRRVPKLISIECPFKSTNNRNNLEECYKNNFFGLFSDAFTCLKIDEGRL